MLSENDQIILDETTTPDTLSTSLRNLNLNHQKLQKINLHFQKYSIGTKTIKALLKSAPKRRIKKVDSHSNLSSLKKYQELFTL